MNNTKEKILIKSLELFAKSGYDAVSVSDIAGGIGITKGALYRHYENKRDIFESILRRMEEEDAKSAKEFSVPEKSFSENPEEYRETSLENLRRFSLARFVFWTENSFASDFRRMLTIEQYKSPAMAEIFSQYLGGGPLSYISDIFAANLPPEKEPEALATEFYGVLFMLMSLYDGAEKKAEVTSAAKKHIENFKI